MDSYILALLSRTLSSEYVTGHVASGGEVLVRDSSLSKSNRHTDMPLLCVATTRLRRFTTDDRGCEMKIHCHLLGLDVRHRPLILLLYF